MKWGEDLGPGLALVKPSVTNAPYSDRAQRTPRSDCSWGAPPRRRVPGLVVTPTAETAGDDESAPSTCVAAMVSTVCNGVPSLGLTLLKS